MAEHNDNDHLVSPELIARKREAIYNDRLRDKLEPKHTGKYVAIEVESGKHFLGESADEALEKARGDFPDRIFHLIRVGYPGVYDVKWSRHNGLYGWLFGVA